MRYELLTEANGLDEGLLYGAGIYETFWIKDNGCAFELDRHLQRMAASARELGLCDDLSCDAMHAMMDAYITSNKVFGKVMRVTLTAGPVGQHMPALFVWIRERTPLRDPKQGYTLCLSDVRKNETSRLLRHKTCNCYEWQRETRLSREKGFDDALFLNTKGDLTETGRCNVFFVKDKILHTPDCASGVLPGVAREIVIKRAKDCGIRCHIGRFLLTALETADEIFVTNSVIGPQAVGYVGDASGQTIAHPGAPMGSITRRLQAAYWQQ